MRPEEKQKIINCLRNFETVDVLASGHGGRGGPHLKLECVVVHRLAEPALTRYRVIRNRKPVGYAATLSEAIELYCAEAA